MSAADPMTAIASAVPPRATAEAIPVAEIPAFPTIRFSTATMSRTPAMRLSIFAMLAPTINAAVGVRPSTPGVTSADRGANARTVHEHIVPVIGRKNKLFTPPAVNGVNARG